MPTRRATKFSTSRSAGFTLLEVIATLIIMGMIAVAATMALSDDNDLRKEADLLRIRLRYAQSKAMGENTPYGITSDGSAYTLFRGSGAAETTVFPGETAINYAPPTDVTLPAFTVSFDQWGVPYASTTQTTAMATALNLVMSTTESGTTLTQTITVTPTTGFVP